MLDSKLTAFDAEQESIEPPTAEQLDKLRGLIAVVEALTVQARILEEVIGLSADALSTLKEIHPDQ